MKQILSAIVNSLNEADDKVGVFYNIANLCPTGITIVYNGNFGANNKFYELIGLSCESFNTVDEYLENCPEDFILYNQFSTLLTDDASFTRLYPIHSVTGQAYYIENFTFSLKDTHDIPYYITFLSDHTVRNDLSVQVDENNAKFRILEELIDDYIFEYDNSTDTLYFPERWKPDGINTTYPHARKWLELHEIIHPDDLPFILDAMNSTRQVKDSRVIEFRAKFWKTEYSWHKITYKTMRSKSTSSIRILGKISALNNQMMMSNNDRAQEGIDPNTGLLIPSYMEPCVDEIITQEPEDTMCALMLVKLDDFENLKKTTGDLYSLRIERQVAEKLKQSFRNTDVLGYSRDGCYAIFLRKVPEHIVTMRANHVLEAVRNITFDNSTPPKLSCSIGIGISPLDGMTYMDLFLKADSAMYLSTARGGNTFSFFNTEVDQRQRMEN